MSEATPVLSVRPAAPGEEALLLGMFAELAEYEGLSDKLVATEELLARALFSSAPSAYALIAEVDGETAGYAVYYFTFSTFLAIQGVWLEDIFVRPARRGAGVGRALLAAVAAALRAHGGTRLEWSALDWNEPALGFYERLGAETKKEWITHLLTGEALERLAAQAP